MAIMKTIGRVAMILMLAVLVAELLIIGTETVNLVTKQGFTIGEAIQWQAEDTADAWRAMFPKEKTKSYPFANAYIEWNWQGNGG